jgi:hypothetical protein
MAQKLRQAADILDDLIGIDRATKHETSKVAKAIKADLPKNRNLHWTQTAKGRKIISRNSSRAWANRKATVKAA